MHLVPARNFAFKIYLLIMKPVEFATSSGLENPCTAVIGTWLPRPMPNPKSICGPMYRALDESISRVYSKAAPAVIKSPLVNWKGWKCRVLPIAAPLTTAPTAKKAKKGSKLTPLVMAD